MSDPTDQGSKMQSPEKSSKTAFAVAASPFNAIKLEVAIILIIAFVLWLVLNSITDSDLTHVAILFVYSVTGAAWITLRIRHVSQQSSEDWYIYYI